MSEIDPDSCEHDWEPVDEVDGVTYYECVECGAEEEK